MKATSDPNLQLAQAMGSKKGYDPIPPDNYRYFLTGSDGVQAVLAWVRVHTIGQGYRSPFAVAKTGGRPLTKADLARHCFQGDRGHACRAWSLAEDSGLVKTDQNGRLCLCGHVKPAQNGEETAKNVLPVQAALPAYLIEKIRSLSQGDQKAITAELTEAHTFRQALERDALSAARNHVDRIEDSILQSYGIAKIRRNYENNHPRAKKPEPSPFLQLNLLLVPEPLQRFVQAAPPNHFSTSCTGSEIGTVQAAPLIHRAECTDPAVKVSESPTHFPPHNGTGKDPRIAQVHEIIESSIGRPLRPGDPMPACFSSTATRSAFPSKPSAAGSRS